MTPRLTAEEQAWLDGAAGEATRLALDLVVRMGELSGAERLLPVTQAHVDACLYTNDAGLEFAERLAALGARVRVPTTLNVTARDVQATLAPLEDCAAYALDGRAPAEDAPWSG